MTEPWTPALSIREAEGRWRLDLGGQARAEGATLQEAKDELVRCLLTQALCLHSRAVSASAATLPAVDLRWFAFLYELSERSQRRRRPSASGSSCRRPERGIVRLG
jgi:hypothetical protein